MNEERPIEKLLRRYAKKRRDESGPAPELHPATRRLLQGEVARQYPRANATQGGGGFWALLRARWIYAVTCLVVLGLGTVVIRSLLPEKNTPLASAPKREMILDRADETKSRAGLSDAEQKEAGDKLTIAGSPPAVAPATAPATAVSEPEAAPAEFSRRARTEELARPEPQSLLESAPARKLDAADRYGAPPAVETRSADTLAFREQPQTAAPTPARSSGTAGRFYAAEQTNQVAAAATLSSQPSTRTPKDLAEADARTKSFIARGGGLERATPVAQTQSFANVANFANNIDAGKTQQQGPAPVLLNFRVEQTEGQLRVIDGDGSTYVGPMPPQAEPVGQLQNSPVQVTRAAQAFGAPVAQAIPIEPYLYNVQGTNVTLRQAVNFKWNFVSNSNQPQNAANASQQLQNNQLQNLQNRDFWRNSAINGQVQINAGPQYELNAAPVNQ